MTVEPGAEGSGARLRILREWFLQHGVVFDEEAIELQAHVRGAQADGDSFGILSKSNLNIDDTVCHISKDAILSIKNCGIADILEEAELGGVFALALALLYEFSLGMRSPWYGYLQSLPERENLPMFWNESDVAELAGTDLSDSLLSDKSLLRDDYETLLKPVLEAHPLIFHDRKHFTFEKFLDASSLVSSRSFEVDYYHGEAMVPLADIFNHKSGAENVHFEALAEVCTTCGASGPCWCTLLDSDEEWEEVSEFDDIDDENEMEESGNDDESDCGSAPPSLYDPDDWVQDAEERSKLLMLDDTPLADVQDLIDMTVVRPCKAGQEVFNTYGERSNMQLLHRYGFAELNNVHDSVDIDYDDIFAAISGRLTNERLAERREFWLKIGRKTVAEKLQPDEEEDSDDEDNGSQDGGIDGDPMNEESSSEEDAEDSFSLTRTGPSEFLTAFLHVLFVDDKTFKTFANDAQRFQRYIDQLASGGWSVKSSSSVVKSKGKIRGKATGQSPIARGICMCLVEVAGNRLKKFPTSLSEDKAKLRQLPKAPSNLRWALILRVGQKEILEGVITQFGSQTK
ncbi:hypothetical protein DFS34DRAFT_594432 [Phlyctochytrium arcticum]|nr:hypothetical protein DFS34DRAFT_594432 [Phlyctochytrium arcticum]